MNSPWQFDLLSKSNLQTTQDRIATIFGLLACQISISHRWLVVQPPVQTASEIDDVDASRRRPYPPWNSGTASIRHVFAAPECFLEQKNKIGPSVAEGSSLIQKFLYQRRDISVADMNIPAHHEQPSGIVRYDGGSFRRILHGRPNSVMSVFEENTNRSKQASFPAAVAPALQLYALAGFQILVENRIEVFGEALIVNTYIAFFVQCE